MCCCLAKYEKRKNVLCCSVSWKGEKRTSVGHVAEIISEFTLQGQLGATNDTGPEESHGMISPSKECQ